MAASWHKRASPFPMVDMEAAWRQVLDESERMAQWLAGASRECALSECPSGSTLAESVVAPFAMPPFAASVKDGYAVRVADAVRGRQLTVVGRSMAGSAHAESVQPGTCVYVATGAPIPDGAEAVLPVEEVLQMEAEDRPAVRVVRVDRDAPLSVGHEVRAAGADVQAGETVLAAGARIGPSERGILATFGVRRVRVRAWPRVAVLSTGNELVEAGNAHSELAPGQVYDSNRPMLLAALQQLLPAGGEVLDLGIASDAEAAARIERALDEGGDGVQVLVVSGGVSMGESDLVKPTLQRLGRMHFGRLMMKPGKPMSFITSRAGQRPPWMAFAMPGNPVSAAVCYQLLVAPALRIAGGMPRAHALPLRVVASLAHPVQCDAERPEFQRAHLALRRRDGDGGAAADANVWDASCCEVTATMTGRQASSRLQSMYGANALVYIPQGSGRLPPGTPVLALVLHTETGGGALIAPAPGVSNGAASCC